MKLIHKSITLSLILSLAFFSCQSTPKGDGGKLNAHEFRAKIKELKNEQLIDVRTPGEYDEGHIEGATNINWNDMNFEQQVSKLDKSKPIMVYCLSGGRSGSAAGALKRMGFTEIYDLQGGMRGWRQAGFAESKDAPAVSGLSMDEYHKMVSSDKFVVVDFYADWCTPCKKMEPFLKEVQEERKGSMTLQRVDADKNTLVSNELRITGLPTLLFYKNGKMVGSHMGYMGKEEILKKIDSYK